MTFTKVVVLALLLYPLGACARSTAKDAQRCPEPAPVDSLLAEIKRDTANAFPSGGLEHRQVDLREDVVFSNKAGRPASVFVAETRPRYTGFYRIGVIEHQAYRLRGWECDNLTLWLQSLPAFSSSSDGEIWLALYRLANALNPVGDSSKLLDPERRTSLPAEQRLSALDVPGAVRPELQRGEDGGWSGRVTVFWYHSQSHGLTAVTWEFRFSREGRLSHLVEKPLRPAPADTTRVLLGA